MSVHYPAKLKAGVKASKSINKNTQLYSSLWSNYDIFPSNHIRSFLVLNVSFLGKEILELKLSQFIISCCGFFIFVSLR